MPEIGLVSTKKTFLSTYTVGAGMADKPFSTAVKLIENTRVARTAHVKNIEMLAKSLNEGDKLMLIHEIGNLSDNWAVRIETQNKEKLGYLPCDCDEIIARMLDGGKDVYAEVSSSQVLGPWIKIDIEVYLDD